MDAKRLDELAILSPGRTGGFTGPAIQAQVEGAANLGVQVEPAIRHRAHQVNTPARAVVLISKLDIGWTGGGVQTAVDAIQKQLIVDVCALCSDPLETLC